MFQVNLTFSNFINRWNQIFSTHTCKAKYGHKQLSFAYQNKFGIVTPVNSVNNRQTYAIKISVVNCKVDLRANWNKEEKNWNHELFFQNKEVRNH